MKENPPTNVLLGQAAWDLVAGKPVKVLYRDQLAERLGVSPKERLTMALVQDGQLVAVSCLLDGGDLTAEQEVVFRQFLAEVGDLVVLGSFPERPVTS